MPNLYALTTEIKALLSNGDDGEIPSNLIERFDALNLTLGQKIEWLVKAMRNHEVEADGIESEVKRLAALAKTERNKAGYIWKQLEDAMKSMGIERIDVLPAGKLWLQTDPPSAHVKDGCEIPEQFRKVTVEFDKKAALAVAKAGGVLPAEVEITQGRSLHIK